MCFIYDSSHQLGVLILSVYVTETEEKCLPQGFFFNLVSYIWHGLRMFGSNSGLKGAETTALPPLNCILRVVNRTLPVQGHRFGHRRSRPESRTAALYLTGSDDTVRVLFHSDRKVSTMRNKMDSGPLVWTKQWI